jgi:hypothetical protein
VKDKFENVWKESCMLNVRARGSVVG